MKEENGERQKQRWEEGESLSGKLMEKREEKQEKGKCRRMRVAAEENRRREESQRSDETHRETQKWSKREREEMLFQDHTY